jgi:predicted PP-loop superfamily ATPase
VAQLLSAVSLFGDRSSTPASSTHLQQAQSIRCAYVAFAFSGGLDNKNIALCLRNFVAATVTAVSAYYFSVLVTLSVV